MRIEKETEIHLLEAADARSANLRDHESSSTPTLRARRQALDELFEYGPQRRDRAALNSPADRKLFRDAIVGFRQLVQYRHCG